jgi:AraC family transcriptional regulator
MLRSPWIPPTGKVVPLPNSVQALLRYTDSISDAEKESLADRLLVLELIAIGDQRPLAGAHGTALARAVAEKLSLNLDEPADLDALSAWAGISRRHLTRLFRRFEGESIHERITKLRIEEATRRIAAGDTVLSASLSVGLSSPSHLSRLFKRYTGVSPSMARKRTS